MTKRKQIKNYNYLVKFCYNEQSRLQKYGFEQYIYRTIFDNRDFHDVITYQLFRNVDVLGGNNET